MLYRPLLRPASSSTLPPGVSWDYVEAPREVSIAGRRPDLRTSRHRYGLIRTGRPLTAAELEHFDIEELDTVSLFLAARKVIDRWSTGDLAEAVRELASAMGDKP